MPPLSSPRPKEAALTRALLRIVAERGLDHVSVREVAAAVGVSIGTVQHYFPTKDAMLTAAFGAVVERVQGRVAAVALTDDVRRNLRALLRQLLPLDEERAEEARVHLAFAARAATSPALAEIQRAVLTEVRQVLVDALTGAQGAEPAHPTPALVAHLLIGAVDGLALNAASAEGWISTRRLTAALDLLLDAVLS